MRLNDRAGAANRTGTSPERIQHLVAIGVLRRGESGNFEQADVHRVLIVDAYERGGIALEDIAQALLERRITFEYADRIYPEPSPPSGRTIGDLADALPQSSELLPELFLALGLPRPEPGRPVTEADERLIPAFFDAWGAAEPASDASLRAARLLGEGIRRIVDGWLELFVVAIDLPPQKRVTFTVDTLGPRMFEPATRVAQLLEPMTVWLLRRHMERALNAFNVETMERALELQGVRPVVHRDPPTIVFADLSGFTQLTEEHGDETAARYASTLALLALHAAEESGGRLVKQLGDGVMLVFTGVGAGIEAALRLLRASASAGLPPLHVGVSAGPVVERDGDYFGGTVNMASRIAAIARPGQILLNEVAATAAREVPVVALGLTEVRGLTSPIPIFELELL